MNENSDSLEGKGGGGGHRLTTHETLLLRPWIILSLDAFFDSFWTRFFFRRVQERDNTLPFYPFSRLLPF